MSCVLRKVNLPEMINPIFYKGDLEISYNPKNCSILACLPAEKIGKNYANFWVVRNFHINLIKNGL